MADQLDLVDGTQSVLWDGHGGVEYRLAVRVDGLLTRATHALLGPGVNALYGQALAAIRADPTLGGLCMEVCEGPVSDDATGAALEVDLSREQYTAGVVKFSLHLTARYWQPTAETSRREAILSALNAVVQANVPAVELTVRERVLSTFAAHLAVTLGGDVVRNADRPQRVEADPVVVLLDGDQDVNHDTNGLTWYTARPAIEVFVSGSSTASLDAQVQLVRTAIRTAGSLGGLAHEVEEWTTDPEVLRQAYSGPMLAARLEVVITYATAEGDPYEVAS